jgi:hypothetical protein
MSGRKKSSCRDYVLAGKPDSDGVFFFFFTDDSSVSSVKCAAKGTASHYFKILLRYSLAMGISLCKYCCSSPLLSIDVGTLILETPGLNTQVAGYKMMSCSERRKDLAQSKVPSSDLIS